MTRDEKVTHNMVFEVEAFPSLRSCDGATQKVVSGILDRMKMTCINILLILFITISLPSCTEYADASYLESALCGTWIWVSSSGGFTGKQLNTPESLGYTKQLRFTSEGEYQEFQNSTLIITSRYSVEMKKTIFGYQDVICFADSTGRLRDKVIRKISGNELHLSDPYPDGFGHFYTRGGN